MIPLWTKALLIVIDVAVILLFWQPFQDKPMAFVAIILAYILGFSTACVLNLRGPQVS